MRFLERVGLVAFNQDARDGLNRCTRFNGRGTGDIGNERFAEFLGVAQIRVGLDERFAFHVKIIAEEGASWTIGQSPNVTMAFAARWCGA